jgi:hypothetical protein
MKMNIGEIEIPDYMQGANSVLATFTREQERCREAMQAIAQPPALTALRDSLERIRVDTPALQMAEQARELASVTDKLAEQMRPALAISERLDFLEINPVSECLAKQCRQINEMIGGMGPLARIDTSPLSEITANSSGIGLGGEMERIRDSIESFRRSWADLSGIDALAGLRDSLPSWPDITAPGLELDVTERQPALDHGIYPVLPLTREAEIERPLVEAGSSNVPVENQEGYVRIFTLENALRSFVADRLSAAFGPGWEKQQVPGDIWKKWRDKRERARAAGDTPGPLIAYADLGDYRAIIMRNDNWQAVFRSFFGRKDFVSECFRRLHPPRHAIAHMRSLTTDELELVRVETRLLLGAMGDGDVL